MSTKFLASLVSFIIYQIYFHPLSGIPGPRLAAVTNLPYSRSYLGGRQPWDILKLHEKYGPVVRISPNDISFNSARSWHDIYGVRKGRSNCFTKSDFYDGGNFAAEAHSIVSERDPAKHRQMRKFLARAFSESSLREQEALIGETIDHFVQRVGKEGVADLTHWFNLLTFDIIGKLAFGTDFQGIASGQTHSLIDDILGSMSQASLSDTWKRFPVIGKIWMLFNSRWAAQLVAAATRHQKYTVDLTAKRINEQTYRKDFMSYLLRDRAEISDIQLAAHASDFVIAGSETTATTLAVVFYHLCRNPSVKKQLEHEILSSFGAYEDINATSASALKYLHAVCLEALRMFPPLPLSLPREVPSPGEMVEGFFLPAGTIVATSPYAASMSPNNFDRPDDFLPERWLTGEPTDILEASRPFSYGPRACLGRALAWVEMNLTICRLVHKYEFAMSNTDLDWNKKSKMQLLWKKPKMLVKLTKRRN
ncbi:cytochrome p450 [Hirsutella rhossiliensis]|uniref:Cytochrome p450 domain-containing protein n=1 Tax=Hirsutella rhossiliensis TaxID=111463 RepID=A0A9P8SPD7_9HYPO|nr:cytochrome p450 domain-containing protein [Hirsutella rhossiliensis]KAH0968825.1 cytochrome p450 domain-containing protein [Hirsutella rhossiliensis]